MEITEIPIAPITEQFLAHLAVLEQIDVNAVGDFLDMASMLMEIKSRMVLPRGGEEEETLDDPRQELVQRLLEYKRFKDAASILEERSREWQRHFPRLGSDLPPRERNLAEEEIQEVELWDLVSAFGRIMRDRQASKPASIVYDETPIHVYMEKILQRLHAEQRVAFTTLFQPGMHKSAMVGVFLATLELVRHHDVRFEQNDLFGEIWLSPGELTGTSIGTTKVDSYEHGRLET
jgi:segregation and condensation protein A